MSEQEKALLEDIFYCISDDVDQSAKIVFRVVAVYAIYRLKK